MVTRVDPKFIFTYEDTTVNVFHVNKGEGLPSHSHAYTHATICHAGSILITKPELTKTLTKESGPVNLKQNEPHEIEATEDGTVFVNIFSTEHQAKSKGY